MISSYGLGLADVDYFVLDEGDRMLDMGFQDDISEIQSHISNQDCRSMVFSATVPKFIQKLAAEAMTNPVMIDLVGDGENQLPDQLRSMAVVAKSFESKLDHIRSFVQANSNKKIMIFTQTKQEARRFEHLSFARFLPIHGDLSQQQREYALNKFKQPGSRHILVGTDVAARGLDVDDIEVVIQVSCNAFDSFVHRSGRTARKGKEGLNILFLEPQELKFAYELQDKLNINIDISNSLGATAASKESQPDNGGERH